MTMGRRQDEAVLRITARYISELQTGQQPLLSDYLARYPQYANAVADFITYYHAVEAHLLEEINTSVSLSDISRIALERAQQRILQSEQQMHTLLLNSKKQRLTLSQLAARLDLSVDVVTLLEQRLIDPASIPSELYKRLAIALSQPLSKVQHYFIGASRFPVSHDTKRQLKVAEDQPQYPLFSTHDEQIQSFRQALDISGQLSDEQKASWYAIIAQEGFLWHKE